MALVSDTSKTQAATQLASVIQTLVASTPTAEAYTYEGHAVIGGGDRLLRICQDGTVEVQQTATPHGEPVGWVKYDGPIDYDKLKPPMDEEMQRRASGQVGPVATDKPLEVSAPPEEGNRQPVPTTSWPTEEVKARA